MSSTRIGSFESKSGQFVISDPSYELDLSEEGRKFQGILTNVAIGKWLVQAKYNRQGEILVLYALHESVVNSVTSDWSKCDFRGAIDSAMLALFDREYYRNNDSIVEQPKEIYGNDIWYSTCSEKIYNSLSGGVMPGGVIICTANDGEYLTESTKSDNQIIGVRITLT